MLKTIFSASMTAGLALLVSQGLAAQSGMLSGTPVWQTPANPKTTAGFSPGTYTRSGYTNGVYTNGSYINGQYTRSGYTGGTFANSGYTARQYKSGDHMGGASAGSGSTGEGYVNGVYRGATVKVATPVNSVKVVKAFNPAAVSTLPAPFNPAAVSRLPNAFKAVPNMNKNAVVTAASDAVAGAPVKTSRSIFSPITTLFGDPVGFGNQTARSFNSYFYARLDGGLFNPGKWELKDSSGVLNKSFGGERGRFAGGRLGSMFTPNLGLEGRVGYALDNPQTVTVGGLDNKFQVRGWGAVMARLQADLGGVVPYINAGVGGVRGNIDAGTAYKLEKTTFGLAAATGVEIGLTNNLVLGIDAFMMPQKVYGAGLSIGVNF